MSLLPNLESAWWSSIVGAVMSIGYSLLAIALGASKVGARACAAWASSGKGGGVAARPLHGEAPVRAGGLPALQAACLQLARCTGCAKTHPPPHTHTNTRTLAPRPGTSSALLAGAPRRR